jgi:Mlc titration factor MtfA (ptsG expression regulator)
VTDQPEAGKAAAVTSAQSAQTISFAQIRNQPVRIEDQSLEVGNTGFRFDDRLNLEAPLGAVSVQAIRHAAENLFRLTRDHCPVQLGVLAFTATGRYRALDFYFPITQMLTDPEIHRFYELTERIARDPHLALRLVGERRRDLTSQMPPAIRRIVAGQLAEVFFQRTELLERFLATPRHIQFYTSQQAFEQDGGVSGGDYNARRQSIQLVLKRVLEGFFGETAGVCPFLHELGHMLDHFDAATGRMGRAEGLLPGLSRRDRAWFNLRARRLFLRGKRLELERYLARCQRLPESTVPFPIGHPYVFQNDGEFIAGYFEMFFRNPNYFASQNPDLYEAFVELFGYDPRSAWKQDFPLYIEQNRSFYLSGQPPRPPGLTILDD